MDGIKRAETALRERDIHRQAVKGLQVQIETRQAGLATEKRKKALESHLRHVEQALAALGEDERTVLEVFFCFSLRPAAAVVRLQGELNVGRSEIYRIRERALWEFAVCMGYIPSIHDEGE